MKTKNLLAMTFSCLLASGACVAMELSDSPRLLADNSTGMHDPAVQRSPAHGGYDAKQHPRDESILDHENREDAKDLGTGTDAVDAQSEGSGTTSESIPDNIPPARAN